MGAEAGDELALLKRWKKKVKANPVLRENVRELTSRLVSGVRLFVEEKQRRLVERVVLDAALVPIIAEKPAYVV